MKLTFIGAAHEVTGSAHYLQVGDKNIIVDYGMEQGVNLYVNQEPPFTPADTDYVFVTHAHIDHTGLLPLLYKQGFRGKVFCTVATFELCSIMLKDCAHIQQFEADWRSRKNRRSGKDLVEPLYDFDDVDGILGLFEGYHYNEEIEVCETVKIRFVDAGHLIGSASIEVWATENDITRKLVFSGDIGNFDQPLIKNPTYINSADYVIMESTYGTRLHSDEKPNYDGDLVSIIRDTFARGGNVIIPCFAVGRTQEVLYHLRKIKESGVLPEFNDATVYVDSPLAVAATSVFNEKNRECFDEETLSLMDQGINPIEFKGLRLSITTDDSKAINFDPKPKIILSASGMCDAGRIRHHLKYNLWRSDSTIVFAGYQSVGTPGRTILDGAKSIKIFGEEIAIQAKITKIEGISGHADRAGLLKWVESFKEKPKGIFVVHGNDTVTDEFAALVSNTFDIKTAAPYSGAVFNLLTGKFEFEGVKEPIKRKQVSTNNVFNRLIANGERLMSVIKKNEGCANKDLAKFADQIKELCDKWDR
ncbi:MBL fold metallo-hydrolase [Eubacterium sp.]|uniref:MBL fold metallo-hydrolase RNA specificity domain-containing protein n=1 Tax=Eubacterium sp. TaxID=142586 RepID=UPI0025F71C3E|nr:MBL fold metallo-hydrolase [Eubacterium sp.]MCR5628974.1 MBL fold metallo-hydrolase [Eubacterium sp.]